MKTPEQYINALKGYVEYAERDTASLDPKITMTITDRKLVQWLEDVLIDYTENPAAQETK